MSATSDEITSDSTGFEMSVETPTANSVRDIKRNATFVYKLMIGWVLLVVAGTAWAILPLHTSGQNVSMVLLNASGE